MRGDAAGRSGCAQRNKRLAAGGPQGSPEPNGEIQKRYGSLRPELATSLEMYTELIIVLMFT
jgi:hypothetical protein